MPGPRSGRRLALFLYQDGCRLTYVRPGVRVRPIRRQGAAMKLTLRTVVRETTGRTGVVIARYSLRAQTLSEAKREVDRGSWVRDGIEPNSFEPGFSR